MLTRERMGNVGIEPVPVHALTADEARDHMKALETCVPREKFASKASVTVRCFRNEIMSREYATELFRLITEEYDVPVARFIGPTADAAVYLYEAAEAAGRPKALKIYSHDHARTGPQIKSLREYLELAG